MICEEGGRSVIGLARFINCDVERDVTESNPYRFEISAPQPHWGGPRDRSLHLVLVHPEIPGNTGNIGRLCAGANVWLHLVEPLGFDLDDRYLKRAGLDYWPHVRLCVHDEFARIEEMFPAKRLHLFTKKATRCYTDAGWKPGSVLVFGKETKGLSDGLRSRYENRQYRIPISDRVRSLNLSNACSIALYEAMRQLDWQPIEGHCTPEDSP